MTLFLNKIILSTIGKHITFLILLVCTINQSYSFNATSRVSGNWATPSTWMTTRTGTITSTTSSTTITGVGTSYTSELNVGDVLMNNAGTIIGTIAAISSNTSLTLSANALISVSGGALTSQIKPSSGDVVNISGFNVTLAATETYTTLTVNLSASASSVLTLTNTNSLNITTAGTINVGTGASISGGNGSSRIYIGGTPIFKGSNPAIVGATSSNGTFALPITLINFTATIEGQKTILSWSTGTEKNNDYFTLEKTKDGLIFEEIQKIKGAGNSHNLLNYKTIDESIDAKPSYYRLKQTDFDGKSTVSDLVTATPNNKEKMEFTLFPNPSNGQGFNIISNNTNNPVQTESLVIIYDSYGKIILEKTFSSNNGSSFIEIDSNKKLTTGIYWVIETIGNASFEQKLIVKE
jgi:hypothetical protein